MGTTYTFAPPMLGLSSVDPWPAFAALRVMSYVAASDERTTESRLVQADDDDTARARDVRAAFTPSTRFLAAY